jgi:hypothetical protein
MLYIFTTYKAIMEGKNKKIIAVVIAACVIVIVILAVILSPEESNGIIDEEFPHEGSANNATTIASGPFQNGAHPTEGEALLIEMDDKMIIRLEDFKTDSGPGLYVYLSVDKTANDYISLGKLKATEGNMNYDVPQGTNTTKYNFVLIWCDPFSVLFGHAELV